MPRDSDALLSPELFVDLIEYVKTLQANERTGTDDGHEDDHLAEDHPLVAFCHDLLEQLSAGALSQRLVGFGSGTRRRLALERRRLERRKAPETLQRVLFELDTVAAALGTATYVRSEGATEEFLSGELLALLDAVVRYLRQARPDAAETNSADSAMVELKHFLRIEEGSQ